METLERVKQTHKTILFENFNSWQKNTLNLAQILRGTYKDVDDEKDKISRLQVHSFKEFIEKFAPKIYESVRNITYTNEDGEEVKDLQFEYSIDDSKASGTLIKLDEHSYYKMLSSMYGAKKNSGQSNRDYDDSKLKEILTPKSEEKEALRLRQSVELLSMQYTEAVNKKENANVYAKQLRNVGIEIMEKFDSSTVTKLGMRINAINNQIHFLENKVQENKTLPPGSENVRIEHGVLDFDEDGKPTIKALPPAFSTENQSSTPLLTAGQSVKMLKAAVEKTVDDKGLANGSFTKKMILANYLPADESESFSLTPAGMEEKLLELQNERDSYERIYIKAQTSFIKILKQIVNRVLDVKVFFDHATVKGAEEGTLPKGQGLLITNCSVGDLINDEKTKVAFEKFIEHRGKQETGNDKIWLGILPHVICGKINPDDQEDEKIFDPFNLINYDEGEKTPQRKIAEVTNLSEAKQLLSIMEKSRILTIFNPAVADDMPFTFGGINKPAIDGIKKNLEEIGIDFEHAVFAYPNFTLIRDALVPVDSRENAELINVGSMYIDAAYVAAGLIVGSQQPKYLIGKGFGDERVDRQGVCVRLNLEDEEITNKLVTNFNCELSSAWSKDIIDAMSEDRFGFAFNGDTKYDRESRKNLENSYIFSERTMNKVNGIFQPVYKTLTKDFILSYLKTIAPKLSKVHLKSFLREDVEEWKNFTKMNEGKGIINLLLRDGEDVKRSEKNPEQLRIILSGGDTLIDVEFEKE